jgi:nucleoid-associated protein YgaU
MARGKHISITSLALIFLATGCIIRTYTIERERPDIEIEGNEGYLQGAPAQKTEVKKKTRTTYTAEIEAGGSYEEQRILQQYQKEKAQKKVTKQKEASGEYYTNETVSEVKKEKPLVVFGKQDTQPTIAVSTQKPTKINTYTVKKGDTLEKIAARPEVYADKKKWYKIYKANEGQLKEPNKIFPGQILNIPE